MDMIVGIIKQLGTDSSFFYQFTIVIVLFLLSKALFFNQLERVIFSREDKTVRKENSTEKDYDLVNEMASEYKAKINSANKEAIVNFEAGKTNIIKKYDTEYKSKENEINKFIDDSRVALDKEISEKKEVVFQKADELSNELLNKITKG